MTGVPSIPAARVRDGSRCSSPASLAPRASERDAGAPCSARGTQGSHQLVELVDRVLAGGKSQVRGRCAAASLPTVERTRQSDAAMESPRRVGRSTGA